MSDAEDASSIQTEQNIQIGKQKKEVGDQAFKAGDVKAALKSYHEALFYFHGVNKTNPAVAGLESQADKNKVEVDGLLDKVYSNMSACHLKQNKWNRVIETADKALKLNENNYKAMFRKGKALGEMGYVEKAEKVLNDLLKKNPADAPTINQELSRIFANDKEREKKHNAKLRGFLSRDKGPLIQDLPSVQSNAPVESARIEEIIEDKVPDSPISTN